MRISLILIMLTLTSCSTYNSQFSCKPSKGIGCKSLSTVNELVNDNKLESEIANLNDKCKDCDKKEINAAEPVAIDDTPYISTENEEEVQRSKEKIIKIWFNEYEDLEGNYNSDQVVYSVLQPSKWIKNAE